MIDFRYHLVSIVSIFLALAVGIVLGAGPLQDNLGVTLGEQVTSLRAEKEALRAEAAEAARLTEAADQYVEAINPMGLDDLLTGRAVLVVDTPDSDGAVRDAVLASLELSGAQISQLAVTDAWVAPDRAQARDQALKPIIDQWGAGGTLPVGADRAAAFLAALTMGGAPSTSQSLDALTARDTAALTALADAGLITMSDTPTDRSSLAVVVGGRLTGEAATVQARSEVLQSVIEALDTLGDGAVVVGGVPPVIDPAATSVSTDLVTVVRGDPVGREVISSVDHANTPVGSGTTVLALVEQSRGGVGHYGVGPDAEAVVPESP